MFNSTVLRVLGAMGSLGALAAVSGAALKFEFVICGTKWTG